MSEKLVSVSETSSRGKMLKDFIKEVEAGTIELDLGGFFNVEGGSFQISMGLYPECEECDLGVFAGTVWDCPICGRGNENTLVGKSGDGDGVYTAWRIWHAKDQKFIGLIAFFDSNYSLATACRTALEEEDSAPDFDPEISSLLRIYSNTKRLARGNLRGDDALNLGGTPFGLAMNQPFLDFYMVCESLVVSLFVEEPGKHSGDYVNDLEHKPRAVLLLKDEYSALAGPEDKPGISIDWAEEEEKSLMVLVASHLESMAETIPTMNFLNFYALIDRSQGPIVDEDFDLERASSWALFELLVNGNRKLVDLMIEEKWDFSSTDVQDLLDTRGLVFSVDELGIDLLGFRPQEFSERANGSLASRDSNSSGLSKESTSGLSKSSRTGLGLHSEKIDAEENPEQRAKSHKFCFECGSGLPGQVKFCPSCGTKLI